MANVKISALPPATTVASTDLLPVVQGGATKQTTPDLLPLSAAAVAALAGKAGLASPAFTGAPTIGGTAVAKTTDITAAIAALVGAAPAALDTLKEIDDQLTADEASAAALATLVGTKAAALTTAATRTASAMVAVDTVNPVDATTGPVTVTLPTPTRVGQVITAEKIDTSTNLVTIAATLRGTAGSMSISTQYESILLVAESLTSWRPVAGHRTKTAIDTAIAASATSQAATNAATYATVLTSTSTTADQAARINAALATTPPAGSRKTVRLVGDFVIASTLLIPSNTTLDATDARITLAAAANCQMLANSDYTNGNSSIKVRGGTWDYNYTAQTNQTAGHWQMCFDFRNVASLHIHEQTILNVAKYAVRIGNSTRFTVEDITLNTHSDGIHVNGPAARGIIRNIKGTTGDDMVALTGRDYVYFESSFGDITDIDIENIHAEGSLTAVKLLGGGTTKLRRINVANIHGTTTTHPVVVINDSAVNGGVGMTNVGSTVIRGVTAAATNTDPTIYIDASAVRDLTIRDVFTEAVAGQPAVIQASSAASIQSLTVENVHLYGTGTNSLVQAAATAQITRAVLRGLYALDSAASFNAVLINGATAAITTLIVSEVHLILASSSYGIALWGTITDFTLSNARIHGPQTVVSVNGATAAELKMTLTSVITSGITFDQIDTGRPVALSLDGCQFGQSGGTRLVNVTGSGALRLTGSAVRNIDGKAGVTRSATQAVSVNNPGFGCDVSLLTPSDGDQAFNTNATLACGTGPVVYNTAALKWKQLYTGLTT